MKHHSSILNRLVLLLSIASINNTLFSQEDSVFYNNSELLEILKPGSEPNFLLFRPEKEIKAATIFEDYKSEFGLGKNDEMISYKVEEDELGFTHYRFQQKYKGIKIEAAQFFVHEKEGITVTASGAMINDLNLDIIPTISSDVAFKNVSGGDTSVKLLYPIELVIVRSSDTLAFTAKNFKLAYKINALLHKEDFSKYAIYVDAQTGNILKEKSLTFNCSVGTCQTLYNGSQSINTHHRSWPNNDYILKDDCHGDEIHTLLNNDDIDDGDNQWSLTDERPATTAHWGVGVAWDYYYSAHGRNGTDDSDGKIEVRASNNDDVNDASFQPTGGDNDINLITLGAGDGIDATNFAALDIIAHEFTHGVTFYTAGMDNENEPGALNESYSDIFGEMVEFYKNGSCDYIHGEEIAIAEDIKRSLRDPNEFEGPLEDGLPNTYGGTYWHSGSEDHGGIHINCGVQNYWFYLLAEGGSGTNDKSESYNVTGIGKYKAAAIAYRALTIYNGSTTGYSGARNHSILAATDLYGSCSNEVIQTANAWYAVGVASESTFYDLHVCGTVSGTQTKKAIDVLSAGTVTGCSSTTVPNGATVAFISANEIDFLPDFTVEAGAEFIAYIDPCAVTSPYKKENNSNENGSTGAMNQESTTKLNSITKDHFNIFPNPNNGIFTVRISEDLKNSYLEVRDILGSVVASYNSLTPSFEVNLSTQPKGIYFVKITSQEGETLKIEKVVVQ